MILEKSLLHFTAFFIKEEDYFKGAVSHGLTDIVNLAGLFFENTNVTAKCHVSLESFIPQCV